MWNSIANLKENLNRIALDVHDDEVDDEISIYTPRDRGGDDFSEVSDRRVSHSFANSRSPTRSPITNGFDSPYKSEIEHYKSEIKRLQESEAEIKILSVNYAALLKEKEDQISRLSEENSSLKENLHTSNAALNASRNIHKANGDHSSNRQGRVTVKSRTTGSLVQSDFVPNGVSPGSEKELAQMLEEKNKSIAALKAAHEIQMKQLGMELDKQRGKLTNLELRLQEEQKLNESFQQELNSMKVDKDKVAMEMTKVRDELNEKVLEIRRLQMEFQKKDEEEANDMVENLKTVVGTLEKENSILKIQKDELEAALSSVSQASRSLSGDRKQSNEHSNNITESSRLSAPGEEMKVTLQKLEKEVKEARQERDKALQELNRLKQHLLEMESEESEKMDEDSRVIEELRQHNEYQRTQIVHLERSLNQSIARQQELKMLYDDDLKKSKEIIDELNRNIASYLSTIDAKNVEVQNLQTALGQYYAEIEAKEHLGEDLATAKEEAAKLSALLKEAHEQGETSKKEKEELLNQLTQAESILAEGKNRVKKLEEDNEKLRRALEQSMTRLNRMSMDSDYFVDRRIVIKLLVTYFQRNHSREVLDLMVRMLGFSDEDKQRIGIAQKVAGKGVVRGVLGLPGRLVGGILGGNSAEPPANMASDNQSFADLWVDFLVNETEREKREAAEAANGYKGELQRGSPTAPENRTNILSADSRSPFFNQNQNARSPSQSQGNFTRSEHSDSEFSTLSLTPSNSNTQISRIPRY